MKHKIYPKYNDWECLVTPPNDIVVPLAELKQMCYVEDIDTDDDSLLESLNVSAQMICEKFIGTPLLTSRTTLVYDPVPLSRVQGIGGMCYLQQRIVNDMVFVLPTQLELPLGHLQDIEAKCVRRKWRCVCLTKG